ncbi:MAG: DMT family protein [Rubrimonas sp.]|uniref:DMT family protein n=1 Tax=Rubrimonas sp. TaxID=2036015 RepID=UPI002FDDF948
MSTLTAAPIIAILLLIASNVFMTFAWYGHLAYKSAPIWAAIFVSWGIAFFEYCLQVPANRIGHGYFSAAQLKTIQEVITLVVFAVFSATFLNEPLRWNHAVGFGFIAFGAFFVFLKV